MTERLRILLTRITAPRMTTKREALFAKRLSLLIRSGMGLPYAFHTLADEDTRPSMRTALRTIGNAIEEGRAASVVVENYPRLFSPLSRELLAIGEASGTLSESLEHLALELRKRDRLWGKLLGAFLYPALLGVLTLIVSAGLITFVFPKVMPLFSGLGTELPLPTRILLSLHTFMTTSWVWLVAFALLLSVFSMYALKQPKVHRCIAHVVLRLPVIGNLLQTYQLALVSRSLGILLKSGIPLPDALQGTAHASRHPLYRNALGNVRAGIERGIPVREALRDHTHLFPTLAADMLAAGEAGGGLSESAFHLADYYEHEFDEATRRLSVLVEPVLMIFMGLVVGFVAISMILPIYAITDSLNAH